MTPRRKNTTKERRWGISAKAARLWEDYKTSTNLEEAGSRHGLDFEAAYALLALNGFRPRQMDRVCWEAVVSKRTQAEIAERHGVTAETVEQVLAQRQKQKRHDYTFSVSPRLREAFYALGEVEALREGLWLLAKEPQAIALENIGVDEEAVTLNTSRLSPADIEMLDRIDETNIQLSKSQRSQNRSLIVRQALERLIIEKGEVERFGKPPGWESRSLAFCQGGVNPVQKIGGRATTITLPLWMKSQLAQYITKKGETAHTDKINLSRYIRNTIDELTEEDLAKLSVERLRLRPIHGYDSVFKVMLVLESKQFEKLTGILRRLDCSVSLAISACLREKLAEPTHPLIVAALECGDLTVAAEEQGIEREKALSIAVENEVLATR